MGKAGMRISVHDDNKSAALHGRPPDPPEDMKVATVRRILKRILADYEGPVAVRLWDEKNVIGGEGAPCTIVFNHPAPLRHLVLHRDIVRLAEDYLGGDLDVEGDMETLFDLVRYLQDHALSWSTRIHVLGQALRLPPRGKGNAFKELRAAWRTHRNSPASISYHYDVSNDFYRLWLDPEMVYSCAYFQQDGQTLAEAQRDKLDYICRKLRLAPGQRLLDIGCGWGALAGWAARHYGVQAHGITLSEQQHAYATEWLRGEGLEGRVTVELRDYRDLPQGSTYDRVVSVGMFEHVGISNLPHYFETVRRVLKAGGLFLNHGITNDVPYSRWLRTPISRFVNRYVFPDGELIRISDVCESMEQAGFEIIDVEGLRRHYALTLRHWIQALEAHRGQALELVGETTYRVWRLYMAGAAHYFEQGTLGVYQVLAGHMYQPLRIPLRRDDLYSGGAT